MPMKPDFDRAAVAAMRVLVENRVTETPVDPLQILLKCPGVRVLSFAKMANEANVERDELIPLFASNQDAATFRLGAQIGDVEYVVVYNARLPLEIIWRGIARELGHVVLGHDGQTRSAEVRRAEALCFAHHLLCPRPVIRLLEEALPLSMDVLSDTTGCVDECVYEMRDLPGARVPAALNRQVRDLFARGIGEYIRFRRASSKADRSPLIDIGTYMENYEE